MALLARVRGVLGRGEAVGRSDGRPYVDACQLMKAEKLGIQYTNCASEQGVRVAVFCPFCYAYKLNRPTTEGQSQGRNISPVHLLFLACVCGVSRAYDGYAIEGLLLSF